METLAAVVIFSGMRLMPLPDCFVGRRNWFYSIGVFWWQEKKKKKKKKKKEKWRGG